MADELGVGTAPWTYSTVAVTETTDGSIEPSNVSSFVPSPVFHSDNFHSKSQRSRSVAATRGQIRGREGGSWGGRDSNGGGGQDARGAEDGRETEPGRASSSSSSLSSYLPPFLRGHRQQRFAEVSDGTDRERTGTGTGTRQTHILCGPSIVTLPVLLKT